MSQAEFVHRLGKIVVLAAQHESMVFVGRGAQFILPREVGLAVRVIAPRKHRVQRIMERRRCSRRDAEKFIDETDTGRSDFVQRYLHRDVADPHLYDLVINLEHMPREVAVELIVNEANRLNNVRLRRCGGACRRKSSFVVSMRPAKIDRAHAK